MAEAARKPKVPQTQEQQLRGYEKEILQIARGYGLDPLRTVFELIAHDQLNEVAAFGGFPTRYPHWRFGMEFEELAKGYTYGLSKIYELVINNDPCYAYLMKSNTLVDQKMVIAHVYGHSDFFKNNMWFSQTNRHMIDEMANHGTRVRRYIERHGEKQVEDFMDRALSLEWLIDYHSVYSPSRPRSRYDFSEEAERAPERRLKAEHEYMDRYINPPAAMEAQRRKLQEKAQQKHKFPEHPTKDVLEFLIEYAPLETWQRDILSMVREESYYFAPQALTKIMNEGWATYWHAKMMMEKVADDSEVIDFADHHSATLGMSPGSLNPYKLGVELWRDIEDRWNKGKFGSEYDDCDDLVTKRNWDLRLNQGRDKIFEVRRIYNDITFIDHFLTKEFCEEQKLFVFRHNPQTNRYEISDREFEAVKKSLLFRLTNMGHPIIQLVDANFRNRSELLLKHVHEGVDIDLGEARDAIRNLQHIWQRPVTIETLVEDQAKFVSFDGSKYAEEDVTSA